MCTEVKKMILMADYQTGEMGLDVAADVTTPQFYADTLGWDLEHVWEITTDSIYPQLRYMEE